MMKRDGFRRKCRVALIAIAWRYSTHRTHKNGSGVIGAILVLLQL
jgi:hypothetical protein